MNSQTIDFRWVRLGAEVEWRELATDRGGFQKEFTRLVGSCPQLGGRVLDIGCGGKLPPPLSVFKRLVGSLDGVDPDPAVTEHPLLNERWNAPLESAGVPGCAYDLAYAYNVLEHVAVPAPFFRKVHQLLKPGGVFWALTPNQAHPFALLSRTIERVGLKAYARRKMGSADNGAMRVNDYPAYYRCNRPGSIVKAIRDIGFRKATFYYHPCLQWDTYFPRRLRWIPRAYDYLVGTRMATFMQILMVRLDK